MGTQEEAKRDKYLKVRMSPTELVEVKLKAREAGFNDVAAFIRFILKERREVDGFKSARTREIVEELKRFGIGAPMLRAAGWDG